MILVKRTEADVQALAGRPPVDLSDDGKNWLEVRVTKPWGHEIERYRDERCSITWLHLHTHQETSMHCHTGKTTILYIAGGDGFLNTLNSSHRVGIGNIVVIEKGAFHQMRSGDTALLLYELETPPNKNDLVRLADRYGRGQGYTQKTHSMQSPEEVESLRELWLWCKSQKR